MYRFTLHFLYVYATVLTLVPVNPNAEKTINAYLANHNSSHTAKLRGAKDHDCNGCVNGYCWSYCANTFFYQAWCYGTSSYSQSYMYHECETFKDCLGDQCNASGGPCI